MDRLPRDLALALLNECTGDELWSAEHCRQLGVPESWFEELADVFESGFTTESQTIFIGQQTTNQFFGIRDVDLAIKLAHAMGLDVDRVTAAALGRRGIVSAIKEAVMDG